MSLYQLVGNKSLTRGQVVDMGNGGHRYGIIQSVVKEDYKLPDKCMVSGAIKFYMQPLNLYMIRGMDKTPESIHGYVWWWRE